MLHLRRKPVPTRNLNLEDPPNRRWRSLVNWLFDSLTPGVPVVSTAGASSLKSSALREKWGRSPIFLTGLYVQQVVAACALLIMTFGASYAQDVRDPALKAMFAAAGSRTSPFAPPTQDVFVTDSGPGLDTGCTFNDDPGHPLIIEIPIDRYVGEVDANGFLVNPAPLIAKGIIPATIEVSMPAYDVDVNGSTPPEHDEALFNGESLGLLTGDNNIWKLNAFQVDIEKVKFPAKPLPDSTPTPVVNTVQINIDLLSTGRWCTAIDWVALVIPIRPEFALTLEPKYGHNQIRKNDSNDTIDIIYKDSVDADCNITEDIGPDDEYPFSGSAQTGKVKLYTKMEPCPADTFSLPLDVKVKWNIPSTSLQDTTTWTGFKGDVDIKMPDNVGTYQVDFEYFVNDSSIKSFSRKLFVTQKVPELDQVPRRSWYEKATTWASGEKDEDAILKKLLGGLYGFGGANWLYYDINVCSWDDLVAEPLTCNKANCYIFSDVFENMAETLGIVDLVPIRVAHNKFVTKVVPSLDPAFTGNGRPLEGGAYNRYLFGSHSLRQKGAKYYDATFNGTYSSETDFIAYNINSPLMVIPPLRLHYETVEGVKVYPLFSSHYGLWEDYEYKRGARDSSVDILFPGSTTFSRVDDNDDGLAEAVVADVAVEIITEGEYKFIGILKKNGQVIADIPFFHSPVLMNTATLNEGPGFYTVSLRFSGEQIYRTGENGPYELELFAVSAKNSVVVAVAPPTFTEPYDYRQFSEIGGSITSITDAAIDENGNGKFDFIEATVTVEIRTAGDYYLLGVLSKEGTFIVNVLDSSFAALAPGIHTLKLRFPGQVIRRMGLDGPYQGVVKLIDTNDERTIGHIKFVTQAYLSDTFEVLLEVDGTLNDQGIDTNDNGLFDILRVSFGADVTKAGTFLVEGTLTNQVSQDFVFTETLMTLTTGSQTLTLDFLGKKIHGQRMNGPYQVEVKVKEPSTFKMLDRVKLGQVTAAYKFTDFEPLGGVRPISLTGNSSDEGVDINGNGLFDQLHVDVELELTTTDFYEWSARLVDANNIEMGFDSRSATLNAGKATINFVFDGNLIGKNCVNGPYFVKGLLIHGHQSGVNLVSFKVAKTQNVYGVRQFENSGDCANSVKLDSLTAAIDQEDIRRGYIRLVWKTGIERGGCEFLCGTKFP